jgi:hypothetical protein
MGKWTKFGKQHEAYKHHENRGHDGRDERRKGKGRN